MSLPGQKTSAPRSRHVRLAVAAAVAASVLAFCSGCASGLAVHVSGDHLVDGQGKRIRLLGVNRSGAEYSCIQGLGVFSGPTDRQAITAMTAWAINAVRVPLNEQCWLGINGATARYSGRPYRRAIAGYVARLHHAHLYVILDLHWNAPGRAQAIGQQPMADLDHAPAFWTSVARTFRSNPAVMFDLYNEPHNISWRCWRDGCVLPAGWRTAGMQRLVDAVRSAGAHQPVIASGLDWGNDLSSWLTARPHDPARQLVAGFHTYDFRSCVTAACWSTELGPVTRAAPVVTTELGQRACTSPFITRYMTWADSAGASYLGWTWNPTGCASPALIRSWTGEPTASGQRFREHLITLAHASRGAHPT